ncbi:MAG: hypothetical protein ACYCZR_03920 [Burkholderiales bacterium]
MTPPGFEYDGKTILFIDPQGKDASFERWRAILYYEPGFAKTTFFGTEFQYETFLAARQPLCYSTYAALCNQGTESRKSKQQKPPAPHSTGRRRSGSPGGTNTRFYQLETRLKAKPTGFVNEKAVVRRGELFKAGKLAGLKRESNQREGGSMKDLQYHVVNTRTGRVIAAFLLATDARKYAASLHAREGVHGPQYEVHDTEPNHAGVWNRVEGRPQEGVA